MAAKKSPQVFKVGDRVQIRCTDWRGRIVEERGALGPGGTLVFGVRIQEKPRSSYIEVREDQLIALPAPAKKNPDPGASRGAESEQTGE